MRLAPEGNIIIYPLFIILLFTCGYGYVFDFESIFVFIIISSLTLPHVFIMKDFVKSK